MENVTILHDYNNLALRNVFIDDIKITSDSPNYSLWKRRIFNSIYLSLFKIKNVSEVILASDSHQSWRKLYWPRYKESRPINREKNTNINWPELFNHMNSFLEEIIECLPFKTFKIHNCEGDDIIAILAMNGLPDKKYVIISTDEDFKQIISDNIIVYSPIKKEFLKKVNTEEFLKVRFLQGQSKDDIFNVLTPNDYPCGALGNQRKPALGNKKLEKIYQYGIDKWINDNDKKYQFKIINKQTKNIIYKNEENSLKDNFKRNKILIDFRMIPDPLRKTLLQQYRDYKLPELNKILNLFQKHEWEMEYFDQIENKLSNLY